MDNQDFMLGSTRNQHPDYLIHEEDDPELIDYKNAKTQTHWPTDHGLFCNGEAAKKWIELIGAAKKTIRVLMYCFTDISVAKALIKAKQRGCKVHVCLDKSECEKHRRRSPGKGVDRIYNMLVQEEIDVVTVTGFELEGQCGIMHAKTLIIDKTDMLVGSNNLSRRARERNSSS